MIPKVIHYCWFGRNSLPESARQCIESWKKYLPDYEIKEWNEDNFDVNIIPYTAEAYKLKKYAFVSDYARFWILYKYGGLYFDTDVEVIKPMDDIIARGPFMGCENSAQPGATPKNLGVNPGLGLGVNPGLGLYREIIEKYNKMHYVGILHRTTGIVVDHVTKIIESKGYERIGDLLRCEGVWIYPPEYFCPKDYITNQMNITNKTCSIHHYTATWLKKDETFVFKVKTKIEYLKVRIIVSLKNQRK